MDEDKAEARRAKRRIERKHIKERDKSNRDFRNGFEAGRQTSGGRAGQTPVGPDPYYYQQPVQHYPGPVGPAPSPYGLTFQPSPYTVPGYPPQQSGWHNPYAPGPVPPPPPPPPAFSYPHAGFYPAYDSYVPHREPTGRKRQRSYTPESSEYQSSDDVHDNDAHSTKRQKKGVSHRKRTRADVEDDEGEGYHDARPSRRRRSRSMTPVVTSELDTDYPLSKAMRRDTGQRNQAEAHGNDEIPDRAGQPDKPRAFASDVTSFMPSSPPGLTPQRSKRRNDPAATRLESDLDTEGVVQDDDGSKEDGSKAGPVKFIRRSLRNRAGESDDVEDDGSVVQDQKHLLCGTEYVFRKGHEKLVVEDLDGQLIDIKRWMCPMCVPASLFTVDGNLARHVRNLHKTNTTNATKFLNVFTDQNAVALGWPMTPSTFKTKNALYNESGLQAVINDERYNSTLSRPDNLPDKATDLKTNTMLFIAVRRMVFYDKEWINNRLIPALREVLANFDDAYKNMSWRVEDDPFPDAASCKTACMPFNLLTAGGQEYPREKKDYRRIVYTPKGWTRGVEMNLRFGAWFLLGTGKISLNCWIGLSLGLVEISHTCLRSDCITLGHYLVESHALNGSRRACARSSSATKDTRQPDRCHTHAETRLKCRLYLDASDYYALGIPESRPAYDLDRTTQGGIVGRGRSRVPCGRNNCASTFNKLEDLHMHWWKEHSLYAMVKKAVAKGKNPMNFDCLEV